MAEDMITPNEAMQRAYGEFKAAFGRSGADLVEVAINAFLDVTDAEVASIRADLDPNADPVCEVIAALIKRAQGVSVSQEQVREKD